MEAGKACRQLQWCQWHLPWYGGHPLGAHAVAVERPAQLLWWGQPWWAGRGMFVAVVASAVGVEAAAAAEAGTEAPQWRRPGSEGQWEWPRQPPWGDRVMFAAVAAPPVTTVAAERVEAAAAAEVAG